MRGREHWARLYECANGFIVTWVLTVFVLGGLVYPAAVAGWYNNLGNLNADWVHHLFLRKEAALLLAGEAPRTLLAGGSGCLFSVDAEAMERELGQPVINLCSHAGVGLEYMLARARRHARPGDTVVLAPEYRVLINPDPRQTRLEWEYFTTWDRRHYLEHGMPEAYRMLYAIPFADLWKSRQGWELRRAGYAPKLHQMYDVMLMSENGNMRESLGKQPVLLGDISINFLPPAAYSRDLVAAFAGWARGHGVTVRAAYQAAAVDAADQWRTKALFAALPQWWREMGIEPMGAPEEALWPPAGFMDTLQHAGPGVAYANGVKLGRALRGAGRAAEWLLVPPHPAQTLLPLPARAGAEVKPYFATDTEDSQIRGFKSGGGRVFVASSALGEQLRQRGHRVENVAEEALTPGAVMEAHRDDVIAICVRPGMGAIPGLQHFRAGRAWAGVWRSGRWEERESPEAAELAAAFEAPLVTGERIDYRFSLRASASACEVQFQQRDRAPSPTAAVRMVVLDTRRGILRGVYSFGADLRAERAWTGEIGAP